MFYVVCLTYFVVIWFIMLYVWLLMLYVWLCWCRYLHFILIWFLYFFRSQRKQLSFCKQTTWKLLKDKSFDSFKGREVTNFRAFKDSSLLSLPFGEVDIVGITSKFISHKEYDLVYVADSVLNSIALKFNNSIKVK